MITISPNNKIVPAIGIKTSWDDIIPLFNKYAVANEEAKIFDKVVPIKQTIK